MEALLWRLKLGEISRPEGDPERPRREEEGS
jgi:hypothetical protein